MPESQLTEDFERDKNNYLLPDFYGQIETENSIIKQTNCDFYAIGDVTKSKKYVVYACESGKQIAYNIINKFTNNKK